MRRFMLAFCLLIIALSVAVTYLLPVFASSAYAPALAERIKVDEDILRPHLQEIFHAHWINRAIMVSLPWVIILILMIFEFRRSPESRKNNLPQRQ